MSLSTRSRTAPRSTHRRQTSPLNWRVMPHLGHLRGSSSSAGPTCAGSPLSQWRSLPAILWKTSARALEYAATSMNTPSTTASRKPPPTPWRSADLGDLPTRKAPADDLGICGVAGRQREQFLRRDRQEHPLVSAREVQVGIRAQPDAGGIDAGPDQGLRQGGGQILLQQGRSFCGGQRHVYVSFPGAGPPAADSPQSRKSHSSDRYQARPVSIVWIFVINSRTERRSNGAYETNRTYGTDGTRGRMPRGRRRNDEGGGGIPLPTKPWHGREN